MATAKVGMGTVVDMGVDRGEIVGTPTIRGTAVGRDARGRSVRRSWRRIVWAGTEDRQGHIPR